MTLVNVSLVDRVDTMVIAWSMESPCIRSHHAKHYKSKLPHACAVGTFTNTQIYFPNVTDLKVSDAMESPNDKTSNERLAHHFVPRRELGKSDGSAQSKTIKTKVTPLAAAALRGNWVLFRHIYDKYERLQKRKWFRYEVRSFCEIFYNVRMFTIVPKRFPII